MLRIAALKNYGVRLSMAEAQQYSAGWFSKYFGIAQYHRFGAQRCLLDGFATSPSGRHWNLSKAFSRNRADQEEAIRCWYNYPTQGMGADLTALGLQALFEMDADAPILTVHDQVVGDIPYEADSPEAREFALEFKRRWEAKINLFYPHPVPITVDITMGPNLGELRKVA